VRIEYDNTLDDVADAHLRAAARSKLVRRTRWQSTFWIAAMTGALIFLWLSLRGATLAERFVFAGLGVTIGAGGHWLNHSRSMKRRILKHLRERMQSDGPFRFVMNSGMTVSGRNKVEPSRPLSGATWRRFSIPRTESNCACVMEGS
jgi:hypothetical protein